MAADKTTLEQMLEHLVNEDNEKAEELFHDYVVSKSREIYENLIQEEMDEEDEDEDKDDEVEESTEEDEDKDSKDEEVDEMFDEVAIEGDDEMPDLDMGGDKTDSLADMVDDEGEDDEDGEEKSEDELFQDLDDIVSELEAKFKELSGDEEGDSDEEGDMDDMDMGDEMPKDESFEEELATVREYVEKVAGGHGAESKGSAEGADNKKSVVDNMKNDMGGTTANIAKGGEDNGKNTGGLADITAKEDNANNVNTSGSKNATKMTNVPGHGAEKKGSPESADNKQSIFRGQR